MGTTHSPNSVLAKTYEVVLTHVEKGAGADLHVGDGVGEVGVVRQRGHLRAAREERDVLQAVQAVHAGVARIIHPPAAAHAARQRPPERGRRAAAAVVGAHHALGLVKDGHLPGSSAREGERSVCERDLP